ncbi:fibronectin type III domain-containing protein [candidate division KSB1 bacterium]|nr:fibronectin type III domain-containing protein [candidate division KSB1 bacterium]
MKKFIIAIIFCHLITISLYAQQVAFPGAEGFGAYTTGGRGGTVYEVTNLNNSGAGSLRDAVSGSNRTIVFRVSGYIDLQSTLHITGHSLTIAGQTAPGDGICVRDYPAIIESNNVIVRYMRFRLGDKYELSSDAFDINDRDKIILDHCSISWGGDECASWYGNTNLTIQWCLIGEGLSYLGHSMGGLWGGNSTYHHNLIYSCGSRHPKFSYTYDEDITDHRNNVVYNWGYQSAYCSPTGKVNIVGNYYKHGPSTSSGVRNRIVYTEYDTKRLHVADNYVYGYPDITADNWDGGVHGDPIRHDDPFPAPAISQQDAETAYELVLEHAGASLCRDSVDVRVIDWVTNRTGQIIGRPGDAGGFPLLNSTLPPVDTDHDGMPDEYETNNALNPNNPDDRNGDPDGDGYTNLEDYLNGLVPYDYDSLGTDTIPPAAPSGLVAKTFSGGQIDLAWTDHADNERGFRIQYSDDNWQTYMEETKALANITGVSVTGLNGSTKYDFRVIAYNMAGSSDFSNTASDSTIARNHFFLWTVVEGPGRIICEPDSSNYQRGTMVTVTAVPDSGYVFDTWMDGLSGVDNPETVRINTSVSIKARFVPEIQIVAPLLYDFGPGPVAPGYTNITTSTSAYTVGTGYGFVTVAGLDQRDRGAPDVLRRDFIVANTPRSFIVDLPNNEYHINFIAGDNMSSAPNGPMDVYAEGVKKISGLYSDGGSFNQQDFTVVVADGQLTLDIVHSQSSTGTWRINALEIASTTAGVTDEDQFAPSQFYLEQNYPNPFNPETKIRFRIKEKSHVTLIVYNVLGKKITTLCDESKSPGYYEINWKADNVSSGIYFYRIEAIDIFGNRFSDVKKCMMMK